MSNLTVKATPHQIRKFNKFYESEIECTACNQTIRAGSSRGIFSLNSKYSPKPKTITAGAYCMSCDSALRSGLNIRKRALGIDI